MPNRIGSMIPGSLYVALAVALLASGPAAGEDKCLAAPNADPPQGNHWYYYVDRAQQRHCWYLGPEHQPVHRAKPAAQATRHVEAAAPHPATAGATTAPAKVEEFVESVREEPPAVMPSPQPEVAAQSSDREAGGSSLRQQVTAPDKAATVNSALDPVTIILILIAGAAAAAGILNHVIFSAKAARPSPARVKGGRAGRIASLASGKAPRALAAQYPDTRKRERATPVDPQNVDQGIHEILLALKRRAA